MGGRERERERVCVCERERGGGRRRRRKGGRYETDKHLYYMLGLNIQYLHDSLDYSIQCSPHNSNLQIHKNFELKENLNYRDPYKLLGESSIETDEVCGAFNNV